MVDDIAIQYLLSRFREVYGEKKHFTKDRALTILCSLAVEASHLGSPEAEQVYVKCRNYVLGMSE